MKSRLLLNIYSLAIKYGPAIQKTFIDERLDLSDSGSELAASD